MLVLTEKESSDQGVMCRHFRVCGGCKFQHIPYEVQLQTKVKAIQECFNKEPEPIIACDSPWRYRNKMEFSFSQSRAGDQFLGLMKSRGRVENLEECYLTSEWFIETLSRVRQWWETEKITAYYPPTNSGVLRTLTLREGIRTGEKMAMLTVSDESFDISSFLEAFPQVDALILRKQFVQKKCPTRFESQVLRGEDHIHEILYDSDGSTYRFRIRGASFFQPNTRQAEKIYQKAIACAELTGSETVLDLYCGTGSLGIYASKHVKQVLGIEIVAEAVLDAKANLTLNNVTNMEILEGDVGELLEKIHLQPSVVFVDPPRAGLGSKTIEHLLRLKPQKIVYVSCNPISQAADCLALSGYKIVSLQPIDQFPHTPHVENIALLVQT